MVNRRAFVNVSRLERLELSGVRGLKYIDAESFVVVPRLKELIARDSGLESLGEDVIDGLRSLDTLDLRGNPLRCDCVMRWMYRNESGGDGEKGGGGGGCAGRRYCSNDGGKDTEPTVCRFENNVVIYR